MEKYEEYFKDTKITVMGLGLLGRGVGDTAFLAECGAELIVTDLKTEEELQESLEKLSEYKNISYSLGGHKEEDFKGRDIILEAAGVPFNSPYLEIARTNGAEVIMSGALFVKLSNIPIIGITGTRGKSTVTHMIHHVLAQTTEGGEVVLGGNIKGVSNLQLLKDVKEDSIAVMELDSWQLQSFGEQKISPQIAVFTNFLEDHMDYYMKSGLSKEEGMKQYFNDKAQIFLNQEDTGVLITSVDVFKKAQELRGDVSLGQEVELVDESTFPEDWGLKVPGDHNRLNAAYAYKALQATSLEDELIKQGLESFEGVEGRLQFLTEIRGVKIYNDNNSTTPTATIAGLKAVSDGPNTVLIVGGTDKGTDLSELVKEIQRACKYVVLYSGSGTEKLKEVLPETIHYEEHERIKDCVEAAFAQTENGDVLLFSPGFSSFGKYYKNEFDRGDQFVALIKEYGNF